VSVESFSRWSLHGLTEVQSLLVPNVVRYTVRLYEVRPCKLHLEYPTLVPLSLLMDFDGSGFFVLGPWLYTGEGFSSMIEKSQLSIFVSPTATFIGFY
jgi:hypothetical protein